MPWTLAPRRLQLAVAGCSPSPGSKLMAEPSQGAWWCSRGLSRLAFCPSPPLMATRRLEPALGPSWTLTPTPCHLPDQHILRELEKKKILVFTPSRRVGGKRVVCYDDRFIVKLAYESDGIVVSNDTYRDLQGERQEWKRFIEERLLMYSFVNDKYDPPGGAASPHGQDWPQQGGLGSGEPLGQLSACPGTFPHGEGA